MTPSIYINLEDDVSAIATRLKRERSAQVVLVCPKRCHLFSDPINLKLLKTQTDLLGKEVFILTMDEKGQVYAKQAGFGLRYLPKQGLSKPVMDVQPTPNILRSKNPVKNSNGQSFVNEAVKEIKQLANQFASDHKAEPEVLPGSVRPNLAVRDSAIKSVPKVMVQAKQQVVEDVRVKDSIFPKELENQIKSDTKAKINKKAVLFFSISAILLIMATFFIILPKAVVRVYPRTEPVTRDIDISYGVGISQADPARLVLPANRVNQTMEASDRFQTAGKKEVGSKAVGTVKIYNFTKQPINLKSATTQFVLNGKTYQMTSELVQVKPTKYSNEKTKEVDETSLGESVEIVAALGGESSNIPAGTRVEVINQVFGSKPQYLYAKTDTPVTGGISRYLSVVTEQDLQRAKDELTQKALLTLRSDLASQGYLLPDNAFRAEAVEFISDKVAGAESPSFSARLKLQFKGLSFKKSEVESLIVGRISQTLSDNKVLKVETDIENACQVKNLDLDSGVGLISVHFEGKAVYKVDVSALPSQLAAKTENQVSQLLKQRSEIERVDVELAPSWQKNFPLLAKKIQVIVEN